MLIWKKRVVVVLLFLFPMIAVGQSVEEIQALEFMKQSFSQIDINRISYISQKMDLNGTGAAKFWPRYQSYLHKQIELRDAQLKTLTKFAGHLNRESLDENSAGRLLKESMAQEDKRLKNRQDFIRSLAGILSAQQKLRLYQLELLLDAQVRSGVLAQIPLAD